MNKKNIVIIIPLLVIIVILLLYIVAMGNKDNSSNYFWCDTTLDDYSLRGTITEIRNGQFDINSNGTIYRVNHKSNMEIKVGQEVSIAYNGVVLESYPLQVNALCFEVK